jgi:hypothetical protein
VIGHLQVNKILTEENEQTYTYAYISYISMKVFAVVTRNITDALEKHKRDTANSQGSGFDPYLSVVAAEEMIWTWFTAVGRFFHVGRSCSVLRVEKEIFQQL